MVGFMTDEAAKSLGCPQKSAGFIKS
jgi:hypothetical protein